MCGIVGYVGHRPALDVLAAEIARERGYDVDRPRNLAKSVTVG